MTEITFNEKELKQISKTIDKLLHEIFVLKNALKIRCAL